MASFPVILNGAQRSEESRFWGQITMSDFKTSKSPNLSF